MPPYHSVFCKKSLCQNKKHSAKPQRKKRQVCRSFLCGLMEAPFDLSAWDVTGAELKGYLRSAKTNEEMFRQMKEYCADNEMRQRSADTETGELLSAQKADRARKGSQRVSGFEDKRRNRKPLHRNGFRFLWRRRRDLNPRAGYPAYSLSRGAPSASWVLLQVENRIHIKGLAERVGFEPTEARASSVFKTGAFNRSAISPCLKMLLRAQTQDK